MGRLAATTSSLEVGAQVFSGTKIDPPASEQGAQLLLEIEEREEPGGLARLELHEHVHVAVETQVIAKHRAEQRQATNMPPLAEGGDRIRVQRQTTGEIHEHRIPSGHALATTPRSSRARRSRSTVPDPSGSLR